MGRWSEYDTDAERLPEGMQRIGYDADTQVYSFRDADGSIWESAPGNQYGRLRQVSRAPAAPAADAYDDSEDDDDDDAPPAYTTAAAERDNPRVPLAFTGPSPPASPSSWRQEMMPLLNWFLLVGLFLLVVVWFISGSGPDKVARSCAEEPGTTPYTVKAGDTCWAIAEASSVSVDDLLRRNQGLDCDKLSIGETVCVPTA